MLIWPQFEEFHLALKSGITPFANNSKDRVLFSTAIPARCVDMMKSVLTVPLTNLSSLSATVFAEPMNRSAAIGDSRKSSARFICQSARAAEVTGSESSKPNP